MTSKPPDPTVLLKMPDVRCPGCQITGNMQVIQRFRATGFANVAGVNVKISAVEVPVLVCQTDGCNFEEEGKR